MPKDDINMEWDFSDINDILNQLGEDIVKIQGKTTKKMADKVKKAVEGELPKSEPLKTKVKMYQHDKSKPYIHMKDDVKVTSMREDEDGDMIREVKGGKYTGYKWKWLEFGIESRNIGANPFMTRSLSKTEQECSDIVNEEISKIMKQIDGGNGD